MKTDDFVDFLAAGAGPAPAFDVSRRLGMAALVGLSASLGIGLAAQGLPIPSLAVSGRWFSVAYALALLASGWVMLKRLSRPVSRVGGPVWALVLTMLVMGGVGAAMSDAPDAFDSLAAGQLWMTCPLLVLLFSLPGLAATLWALRGLAPTRLRLAGFTAGVFAGAQGVLGYLLVCPEESLLLATIWYTLGVLLSGVLGMLIGQKALRW